MKIIGEVIAFLVQALVVLFIGFMSYTLFIWGPVLLYARAECLAKGYPESDVSVGLSIYCMSLDGSVTVRVDHQ